MHFPTSESHWRRVGHDGGPLGSPLAGRARSCSSQPSFSPVRRGRARVTPAEVAPGTRTCRHLHGESTWALGPPPTVLSWAVPVQGDTRCVSEGARRVGHPGHRGLPAEHRALQRQQLTAGLTQVTWVPGRGRRPAQASWALHVVTWLHHPLLTQWIGQGVHEGMLQPWLPPSRATLPARGPSAVWGAVAPRRRRRSPEPAPSALL